MASLDNDDPGRKLKQITSKKELADAIGFADVTEYNEWRESKLFRPMFDVFYEEVIKPQQEAAAAAGKAARPRQLNLGSVEAAIYEGERHGRCKYTDRQLDKTAWAVHDHYAYTLCLIKEENTRFFKGIFLWEAEYGRRREVSLDLDYHAIRNL